MSRNGIAKVLTPVAFAALVVTAQAAGAAVLVPVDPATVDDSYASANGDQTAQIDFINHLSQSVDVYWINYSGGRVFYTDLLADSSYIQETFITHPWLIALTGSGDTTAQGSGVLITAFASAVTPAAWGSGVYDIANIGVPEPAAWATLLVGLGAIGGLIRHRARRRISTS